MFKLSRGGEYALHALISLAAKEGDGYTLISELAELDGAKPKYLAKIFQKLVKAEILKSSRGGWRRICPREAIRRYNHRGGGRSHRGTSGTHPLQAMREIRDMQSLQSLEQSRVLDAECAL